LAKQPAHIDLIRLIIRKNHAWNIVVTPNLYLDILPQPDDTTCGPTCLHAVYRFYGDSISLSQIIDEVKSFESGGTLAVFLACHALKRGYHATIFTYNLHMFDPTWFRADGPVPDISERIKQQALAKESDKMRTASQGYLNFFQLGGKLKFQDLTRSLLRKHLNRSIPILAGLSSTYLYRSVREIGLDNREDDVRGEPVGHFVILCGYNPYEKEVLIADPLLPNPVAGEQYYTEKIDRVLGAILLGVLTHDANFLIIRPKKREKI